MSCCNGTIIPSYDCQALKAHNTWCTGLSWLLGWAVKYTSFNFLIHVSMLSRRSDERHAGIILQWLTRDLNNLITTKMSILASSMTCITSLNKSIFQRIFSSNLMNDYTIVWLELQPVQKLLILVLIAWEIFWNNIALSL